MGCHPDKSELGGQQHARHRAASQRTTVSTAETPSRRTRTSRAFWGTMLSVEFLINICFWTLPDPGPFGLDANMKGYESATAKQRLNQVRNSFLTPSLFADEIPTYSYRRTFRNLCLTMNLDPAGGFPMLLSALRKVRHRTFAGHEEVGTSPDGHEARQRCGALVEFFARDVQGRRVLRTAIIADQGISTA